MAYCVYCGYANTPLYCPPYGMVCSKKMCSELLGVIKQTRYDENTGKLIDRQKPKTKRLVKKIN